MTKSSKIIIALLIILLIAVFAFGGYFIWKVNDEVEKENNDSTTLNALSAVNSVTIENNNKNNTATNSTTSIDTSKILLDNQNEDIVYDYLNETIGDHVYKIPIINIDSKDAVEMNLEIMKLDEIYTDAQEDFDVNSYAYDNITYEYYINGDILSILIGVFYDGNDWREMYTYNINTKTGKKVSNAELLEYKNIDESEFSKKLSETVGSLYKEFTTNNSDLYSEELYKSSTSAEICSINNHMYLNDNGQLCVCVQIEFSNVDNPVTIVNFDNGTIVNAYSELLDK